MTAPPHRPETATANGPWERISAVVILVALVCLVALLFISAAANALDGWDRLTGDDDKPPEAADAPPTAEDFADLQQKVDQSADKVDSTADNLDRVLSLLEGASVLVGLALGAAAYFGFRTQRELRDELLGELAESQQLLREIGAHQEDFDRLGSLLTMHDEVSHALGTFRGEIEAIQASLRQSLNDTVSSILQTSADLQIASQALDLNNFDEAYEAARRVLANHPDNPHALYMVGWLELQYVKDRLQDGIDKLKRIKDLYPDWPTARAAYGVGLRRMARGLSGDEQRRMYTQAEGELLAALGISERLLDFNRESFWGPVAGIRRDMGNLDGAIKAYQQALDATPYSSYPMGNLATLYLIQGEAAQALDAFEKTARFATAELAISPNDYFHAMDIAMANTMLIQRDIEAGLSLETSPHQTIARESLDNALSMANTTEMLDTSLKAGWALLLEHCPADWSAVRNQLAAAAGRVREAMAALGSTRDTESHDHSRASGGADTV